MNNRLAQAIVFGGSFIIGAGIYSIIRNVKKLRECEEKISKRKVAMTELNDLYDECQKRHDMFTAAKKQFEIEAKAGELTQFTYEWVQCSKEAMDDIILKMEAKLEEAKALI